MMRKNTVSALLGVAGFFLLCGPVEATWHWTHGNSGHLETDPGAGNFVAQPLATGLKVDPTGDGTPGWVHYAVPSIGDATQGARLVMVRFTIENALNSRISMVRVYNGSVLVKSFPVNWYTAGPQTKTLDLGAVYSFPSGMGVSIRIESGPDSGIDTYYFSGVGANFVAKP